ncbi:thioredoxin trx1 [Conoideocrella luteorostrata]|uniref:Thioredoxin n=1 Tax=Conoideocrella luteorostrata TaxID=1105319 RepID=A0AAJ0CFN7_9HYPO|nr:thioredoxin trx1 [Conoideocrella luteorostrata]
MSNVVTLKDKAEFDELLKSGRPVAVQAHAEWCGPCKAISPIFEKHSSNTSYSDIVFARFDTDEVADLSQELGIRSIPAFFAFKDGNKVDGVTGANPPALEALLKGLKAPNAEA